MKEETPWKTETKMEIKDNLNIRQTINHIKNDMEDILGDMFMRYNTPETRHEIQMRLEPRLKELHDINVIYDYKITCNETNNPPDVIDQHRIVLDTYIHPHRTAEIISLRAVLNGDALNENNEPKGQVFCEIDPYGEENWEE